MEFTAKQIASFIEGKVEGDENAKIHTFAKIEEGVPGAISFLSNPKYTHYIYDTESSVVLVNEDVVLEKPVKATLIRVKNAYECVAKLLQVYQAALPKKSGVSQAAFISESAKIGKDCYIGAFAYIGDNVEIGDGTLIHPHAVIEDGVKIGAGCQIYPNVTIYQGCKLGNNVTIHAGSVIGADGFGFAPNTDGYDKIPQIGIVTIEDDVEIGANTCVDRSTMGTTIIRKGVKLDNLVQIAHNVEVGENTVMSAQVGVAGSTKIGKWCMFGGQVGISGHINIGDKTFLGAQSGVPGSSNAVAISRRLGLKEEILQEAVANLSESGKRFENILRAAEQSRLEADEARQAADALRREWEQKIAAVDADREKLNKEREKLLLNSKIESRRIIHDRTERAEELLAQIEEIAHQNQQTEADLIRARTLKNKLADTAYAADAEEEERPTGKPILPNALRRGMRVFVPAMNASGEVLSCNEKRGEAEVLVGNMRLNVKARDLFGIEGERKKESPSVRIQRHADVPREVKTELNLLGLTVSEAQQELDQFIDQAVMGGLEEVKIIHGVGTGKLKEGVRNYLRSMKNVKEFRGGAYGEGDAGVTIVKLK